MGQAKNRGSFAQRQASAVDRDRKAQEQRIANQADKPMRTVKGLAVLALMAQVWPGKSLSREDW